MMKVLTTASQKGGAGKSHFVTSTTVCAFQAGWRVTIVDIDRQGSAFLWGCLRHKATSGEPPYVIRSAAQQLEATIAALGQNGCDLVIIDTPGTDSPEVDMALRLADLTILPCQPSVADIHATRVTFAKAQHFSRQALHLINMVPSQGQRADEARACLAKLSARWLSMPLMYRVAHRDSFKVGLGVTEYEPAGSAAHEVAAVWVEIAALLGFEGRGTHAKEAHQPV